MASTDLKVKSSYAGKTQTLTLSDANTEASDAVLLEFGQKIINLTDNTYAATDKVTTVNLDTETSAGKQTPTLTLSTDTQTLSNIKSSMSTSGTHGATITTNSDAYPYAYIEGTCMIGCAITEFTAGTKDLYFYGGQVSGGQNTGFTVHVCLPETDTYKSAEATFTVTV